MGIDATNAIHNVSYEADRLNKGATQYHKNFIAWLEKFQKEDLVGCCAQTDVKGDRMKRPSEQRDPDMYVHVVEKKSDGIVVRGAKVHISEASVADEILVVPTRALLPEEKDWAVAFAVPADWEGVKQVVSIHNLRNRNTSRGDSHRVTPTPTRSSTIASSRGNGSSFAGKRFRRGLRPFSSPFFHRHSYSGCSPPLEI